MFYHSIIILSLEQCQRMFLDHSSREIVTNQCQLKRFIIQNYNVLHVIYSGRCRLQAGLDGEGFFSTGRGKAKNIRGGAGYSGGQLTQTTRLEHYHVD